MHGNKNFEEHLSDRFAQLRVIHVIKNSINL